MYENLKKAERALGRRPLLLVCLAFMAVLIFLNALSILSPAKMKCGSRAS